MSGDCEHGRCEVCGKEGILVRTYFDYPINCECCAPQHSLLVRHHRKCVPREPTIQKIYFKTEDLKNPLPIALDILRTAMKDTDPGSYYYSWVSNIACCFMDTVASHPEMDLHDQANAAAEKFIGMLLAK